MLFRSRTKVFKKLADFIERKLSKNSKNIDKKTKSEKSQKKALWLKILGVFGFVALPLPLTGVWTGTCLALFIGLNKKQTMITVILGNLVAGLIMTLISFLFEGNTSIVLYAFLILVAVFVLYEIIKAIVLKIKNKGSKNSDNINAEEGNNDLQNIEAKEQSLVEENSNTDNGKALKF